MTMKNKYFVRSHISEKRFREIIRYFSIDLTATQISSLTGLNINTANSILMKLRKRIAEFCEKESVFSKGEVEIDESYFGAKRLRGKRGRGARGSPSLSSTVVTLTKEALELEEDIYFDKIASQREREGTISHHSVWGKK